eukprot:6173934-Pleurochrysis_carterae.AAC.3
MTKPRDQKSSLLSKEDLQGRFVITHDCLQLVGVTREQARCSRRAATMLMARPLGLSVAARTRRAPSTDALARPAAAICARRLMITMSKSPRCSVLRQAPRKGGLCLARSDRLFSQSAQSDLLHVSRIPTMHFQVCSCPLMRQGPYASAFETSKPSNLSMLVQSFTVILPQRSVASPPPPMSGQSFGRVAHMRMHHRTIAEFTAEDAHPGAQR